MRIQFQKELFLEKLQLASHFTSTKLTSSTALQGVLLKGQDKKLHIYSTNLSTYYHTTLPLKEELEFQVLVDVRKLIEFLTFINPGLITIDIDEKQIALSSEKTKGNFPVMTVTEFPFPPEIKDKGQKIDSTFLTKNLPLLIFTASKDDSRLILTGINFVNSEGELLLVATDGFRLSLFKEKITQKIPSMIIPSDFLDEILKQIKEKEVLFSFSSEEKIVRFKIDTDEFYSRLIEGDFPPFEKVLLSETKTKVIVDRAELLRNVKLISIFAREFSNVVICEFKKDGLYIRPKKEANEENSAFQEIEITGDEQKVAFNYKFLLDLLNHVEAKNIIIEILRPDAPISFKLEKNSHFTHIIMPVRIQE